jgi:predicted outer membrane repeat protein
MYGGAIYYLNGFKIETEVMAALEIVSCEFTNNEAKIEGGAIYNSPKLGIFDPPKYIIKGNSTFIGNKALKNGGAIRTSGLGSIIYMENVVFQGNTATNGNGGAIYFHIADGDCGLFSNKMVNQSTILKNNVIFYDNVAKYAGGAIFADWCNIPNVGIVLPYRFEQDDNNNNNFDIAVKPIFNGGNRLTFSKGYGPNNASMGVRLVKKKMPTNVKLNKPVTFQIYVHDIFGHVVTNTPNVPDFEIIYDNADLNKELNKYQPTIRDGIITLHQTIGNSGDANTLSTLKPNMNIQLNISLIQLDSSSSNKVTSTIHAPTKFVVFQLTHMFRISACDKGFEWNDVTRKCLVVTDIFLVVIFGILFGLCLLVFIFIYVSKENKESNKNSLHQKSKKIYLAVQKKLKDKYFMEILMLVKGIIGSAGALSLEWGSYLSIFEAPNATIELYGRFKYPFLICLILSTIVSIFTIFEYFLILKNKVDNMRNGIQVSEELIVGRERRRTRKRAGTYDNGQKAASGDLHVKLVHLTSKIKRSILEIANLIFRRLPFLSVKILVFFEILEKSSNTRWLCTDIFMCDMCQVGVDDEVVGASLSSTHGVDCDINGRQIHPLLFGSIFLSTFQVGFASRAIFIAFQTNSKLNLVKKNIELVKVQRRLSIAAGIGKSEMEAMVFHDDADEQDGEESRTNVKQGVKKQADLSGVIEMRLDVKNNTGFTTENPWFGKSMVRKK